MVFETAVNGLQADKRIDGGVASLFALAVDGVDVIGGPVIFDVVHVLGFDVLAAVVASVVGIRRSAGNPDVDGLDAAVAV